MCTHVHTVFASNIGACIYGRVVIYWLMAQKYYRGQVEASRLTMLPWPTVVGGLLTVWEGQPLSLALV